MMNIRFAFALACALMLFATGCNSHSGSANTAAQPAEQLKSMNACTLVESAQIAAVQGGTVKSSQPSNQNTGQFAIARCLFTVASAGNANLSVHLEVIQPDPKSPNHDALTAYWEKSLQRANSKGEEEEEGKEPAETEMVAGVGERAFWFGNEKAGVLYAMEKNSLIRLSLGGPGSAENKIEKSKTLMTSVLGRLSQPSS